MVTVKDLDKFDPTENILRESQRLKSRRHHGMKVKRRDAKAAKMAALAAASARELVACYGPLWVEIDRLALESFPPLPFLSKGEKSDKVNDFNLP